MTILRVLPRALSCRPIFPLVQADLISIRIGDEGHPTDPSFKGVADNGRSAFSTGGDGGVNVVYRERDDGVTHPTVGFGGSVETKGDRLGIEL